jgi:hypothetical protein
MIKQGEIVDYARAAPIKRDAIGICRLVQKELDIYISERGAQQRQPMQEAAFVLSRLYRVLLVRHLVLSTTLMRTPVTRIRSRSSAARYH